MPQLPINFMIVEFIKGVVAGIPLALSVGPGTFFLMNAGLREGSRKALWVVAGIWFSDVLILALMIAGNKFIYDKSHLLFTWLLRLMAFMVTLMGIVSLFRKTPAPAHSEAPVIQDMKRWKSLDLFLKGMLINAANPMNYFFWMGIVSLLALAYIPFGKAYFSFLAGLMLLTLAGDLFKLAFSGLLRKILSERINRMINKVVSIILIFAGIYFLFRI